MASAADKFAAGFLLLVVSTVSFAKTYYAGVCQNSCKVATPVPDRLTLDVLHNQDHFITYQNFSPGDTIVICNVQYCTKYTYSDDHNYIDGQTELRADHPGDAGGGVGGGGGTSGGPNGSAPGTGTGGGGGGTPGVGTPTVTVGNPNNNYEE